MIYVAAFIFLASWFRYQIFVRSTETQAWNKIYSDVLDKTPSCIAVMDASGEIIYSNSEFKKTVQDNPLTFFRNVSKLKVREVPPDYLRKIDLQSTKKASNIEDSNINDNLLDFAGSPRLPSSFRFDVGKAFSENSLTFSTLEDLLDIYKGFLTEGKLETEEQLTFDAKMQRALQSITFSYEITICPIIEHKKIILIINNTTHRDLIVSLEHTNDYKDKLLASVSHEFRTPLNGNLGLLQAALDDQSIPQKAKESLLQPALRSGKLLSHLVDDILDYSKAQEDKLIPRYETKSFADTLNPLWTEFINIAFFIMFQDKNQRPIVPSENFIIREIRILASIKNISNLLSNILESKSLLALRTSLQFSQTIEKESENPQETIFLRDFWGISILICVIVKPKK